MPSRVFTSQCLRTSLPHVAIAKLFASNLFRSDALRFQAHHYYSYTMQFFAFAYGSHSRHCLCVALLRLCRPRRRVSTPPLRNSIQVIAVAVPSASLPTPIISGLIYAAAIPSQSTPLLFCAMLTLVWAMHFHSLAMHFHGLAMHFHGLAQPIAALALLDNSPQRHCRSKQCESTQCLRRTIQCLRATDRRQCNSGLLFSCSNQCFTMPPRYISEPCFACAKLFVANAVHSVAITE